MTDPIRIIEVRLRLRAPVETRNGPLVERRSLLVGIGDGPTGWGEAPFFPSGRFGTPDETWRAFAAGTPMTQLGAAALTSARRDLAAKRAGVPLHAHAGGTDRPVLARHPVGLTKANEVERVVGALRRRGLRAIKLKIGPGHDVETLTAFRESAPWLDVAVDGNGAYDDHDDPVFASLDGTTFVEQPFPAGESARAASLIERGLTIAFDEELDDPARIDDVLRLGPGALLSIKLNRHGWDAFEAVAARARDAGVGLRVGGTFDTAVGRRHLLAAAMMPDVTDAAVGPPSAYLETDVAAYPEVVDGMVRTEPTPGIGVDPDPARVALVELRSLDLDSR